MIVKEQTMKTWEIIVDAFFNYRILILVSIFMPTLYGTANSVTPSCDIKKERKLTLAYLTISLIH